MHFEYSTTITQIFYMVAIMPVIHAAPAPWQSQSGTSNQPTGTNTVSSFTRFINLSRS